MYTVGPTERPNGVRKGPRRAKMAPKTLLGPCGPILTYFGGGGGGPARNFSKSFWAKIGQKFFFKKIALFRLPKGQGASKTQIDPVDPPVDPILAQFVGKKADFGVKKRVFLKKYCFAPIHFSSVPRWSGTVKNPKLAS